jgi:hypothetical protein
MVVLGVIRVGRPNRLVSASSAAAYGGAERYARDDENCVPNRSVASITPAFSAGCVSRPR